MKTATVENVSRLTGIMSQTKKTPSTDIICRNIDSYAATSDIAESITPQSMCSVKPTSHTDIIDYRFSAHSLDLFSPYTYPLYVAIDLRMSGADYLCKSIVKISICIGDAIDLAKSIREFYVQVNWPDEQGNYHDFDKYMYDIYWSKLDCDVIRRHSLPITTVLTIIDQHITEYYNKMLHRTYEVVPTLHHDAIHTPVVFLVNDIYTMSIIDCNRRLNNLPPYMESAFYGQYGIHKASPTNNKDKKLIYCYQVINPDNLLAIFDVKLVTKLIKHVGKLESKRKRDGPVHVPSPHDDLVYSVKCIYDKMKIALIIKKQNTLLKK